MAVTENAHQEKMNRLKELLRLEKARDEARRLAEERTIEYELAEGEYLKLFGIGSEKRRGRPAKGASA